jgi:hypothetical protein
VSLLRTRAIAEGSILAYTGVDPEDGQTFLWGNAKDFDLAKGDVVQVLEINRRDGTPWARVLVAVLKGKCCGRVGQVSINLEARLQRAWQTLTTTGSMAPVRATGKHRKLPENGIPLPAESGIRHAGGPQATTPATPESMRSIAADFAGDEFGNLSILPKFGHG